MEKKTLTEAIIEALQKQLPEEPKEKNEDTREKEHE